MIIHDVAVTSNSARMLCVGTLTASSEGLKPSKSRAEKQIIGEREEPFFFLFPFSHTWVSKRRIVRYKLYQSSIWIKKKSNGKFCKPFSIYQDKKNLFLFRSRVPVLHDVRDITLSTKDQVALVSYENKVCLHRPPRGVGEKGINGRGFFFFWNFSGSTAALEIGYRYGKRYREAYLEAYVHAQDFCGFCRSELFRWETRPTGVVRRKRCVCVSFIRFFDARTCLLTSFS